MSILQLSEYSKWTDMQVLSLSFYGHGLTFVCYFSAFSFAVRTTFFPAGVFMFPYQTHASYTKAVLTQNICEVTNRACWPASYFQTLTERERKRSRVAANVKGTPARTPFFTIKLKLSAEVTRGELKHSRLRGLPTAQFLYSTFFPPKPSQRDLTKTTGGILKISLSALNSFLLARNVETNFLNRSIPDVDNFPISQSRFSNCLGIWLIPQNGATWGNTAHIQPSIPLLGCSAPELPTLLHIRRGHAGS